METISDINSSVGVRTQSGDFKLSNRKKAAEVTVVRVRDFKLFMELLAKFDLWDEMEAELKSQGCTEFRISLKPMVAIGLALKEKVASGDLPSDSPAMAACGCAGCGGGCTTGGDAGADGGASTSGGVMEKGSTTTVPH
jgi:hypothetical protein